LAVYFESTIGEVIVTVISDSTGTVYQDVVDTGSTTEIFIPSTLWSPGTYRLTISYENTLLWGDFLME